MNEKLKQKKELETVSDINYWRGIEKVYEEKLNEYLDRIIFLEKRDAMFEMENMSLREEMESSGKLSQAAKYDFNKRSFQ